MFKNYLLVAVRSLRKNKSYIIINTFGLGIALACCITAYMILAYNIEFDHFHAYSRVGRMFKIHSQMEQEDGKIRPNNNAPMALAPVAAQEVAGIERFTRFISDGGYVRYGEKAFSERIAFTDSTFFEMFEFPIVKGNYKTFKEKYSIFISEKMAEKYFADEDPVGKMLVLNFPNEFEIEAIVGGVIKKIPENSTFTYDFMMRIEILQDIHKLAIDNWADWRDPSTFFEITDAAKAAAISKQLDKYMPIRNEAKKDSKVTAYTLEHFKSDFTQDDIGWGYANVRINALPIIVFTAMAGLILLIACFNLTNTSIAMTSKRLKEVGVRKTVGAARPQIVSQFLFETVLSIVMSLIVGLLVAQWIVPVFVAMWNLPFSLGDLSGLNLFISLMILVFFSSLLAGIYPALYNSKFKPVALLKGAVKITGTNALTRTLVAGQFALSVIMLVGGVLFIQNMKFQEKINFGYDKEMVITVNVQNVKEFEAMENAIESHPKILEVSVSDHHVGYNNYQFPVFVDTAEYTSQHMGIGKNYFETMGLKLAEGRFLNLENASDRKESVVVNRAFISKTNLQNPIDKIITVHEKRRHIVGIIEDHVDNVYRSKEVEPFVFYPADSNAYKMMQVRAEPGELKEVKEYLEKTWKTLFPTKPFESQYQEDIVMAETKIINSNLKQIFLFLTVLGGLLSVSGIFSLASLNIARRTKEIGIRKALGANIGQVVTLLNREFVVILTLAVAVGGTIGFFLTGALLGEIYTYHIPVGIIPVALCALLIFCIGVLTTSMIILRAARANPVDALRNE